MRIRGMLGEMVAEFAGTSAKQLRPEQLALEALCEAMHGHQAAAIGLSELADMWCKHGIQWFAQNMQPNDDIRTWVDRLEKDKASIDGARNVYMRFGRVHGAPRLIAGTTSTQVCELDDKTFDAAKRTRYLACLPRLCETAMTVYGKPIDANRKIYRFELMSHIAALVNRMEHVNSLLGLAVAPDTCRNRFNGRCEMAAVWAERFNDFFRVNATPDGEIKVLVQALRYNCFVSFIPAGLSEKASLWVEQFPDVFEEASGATTAPLTRTTAQMFLHVVTALPELFSALKKKEVDMDREKISVRGEETDVVVPAPAVNERTRPLPASRPLVLLPLFDHEKGQYLYPDGSVVRLRNGVGCIWSANDPGGASVTCYGRGNSDLGYEFSEPGQAAAALLALDMGPTSLPGFSREHLSAAVVTIYGEATPEWRGGRVGWVATDAGEAILRYGANNEGEVIRFDTLEAALEALEDYARLPENTDDPDCTRKVSACCIANKTVKRTTVAAAKTVVEFTDGTWCEVLTYPQTSTPAEPVS